MDPSNAWNVYLSELDAKIDPCEDEKTQLNDSNLALESVFDPNVFPTGDFDLPKGKGADGCTYHGDGKGPGKMTCGKASLDCGKDPVLSEPGSGVGECTRALTVYPRVICKIPISS